MVGLVLVSHSRRLAEAACGLAKGVGNENLPIDFAGGTGDGYAELGTDATDIMDAIRRVDSGGGVAVLMDLGSAVLSARMAAELLEGETSPIRLCPAPLVEGAVAAAVQIGAGADLDAVCREAISALAAKVGDMAEDGEASPSVPDNRSESAADIPGEALRIRFTIGDPNGMHTRPAAELVKALGGLAVEARIRNATSPSPFVNARSLNQITLSNIRRGDGAEFAAWGADAPAAIAAVRERIKGPFMGEEVAGDDPVPEPAPGDSPASEPSQSRGIVSISPGMADGCLVLLDDSAVAVVPKKIDDPAAETARFTAAIAKTRDDMSGRKNAFAAGSPEAAILEAQLLILDDENIIDDVGKVIRSESRDAASAWQTRMRTLANSYRSLPNPYLRERAADVEGVAAEVLAVLSGKSAPDRADLENVVIYAGEVSPAQVGKWKPGQLVGILTAEGGPTSHVAILAKSLGIPALMGVFPPAAARTGDRVLVDGNGAEVFFDPTREQAAAFRDRQDLWNAEVARDAADSRGVATTRDGTTIPVLANVGDENTARAAAANGAEGIGLLRTEFMFLDRLRPPDEDEQTERLSRIFAAFPHGPVTVRTLDVGGDKAMPWLRRPPEANPFLGERGIRLCMSHPELFHSQLRAILRAGAGRELEIMIPMAAQAPEIDFFLDHLEECHAELLRDDVLHAWPVRRGIMIETPAAVIQSAKFATRLDFFSIGSNDLTQYVLCAERGSRLLKDLSDGMHPAVLASIRAVAAGAKAGNASVAVCGELASDPVAVRALIGLGVDHLSVSPSAVGKVKRAIRGSDARALRLLTASLPELDTPGEARSLFSLQ